MRNDGYTLIEMVLVVVIIGILASVAIQSLNKTENSRRMDETMAEMERIARAIAGDERLITDGVRTDFGYVGDVGSLPSNLDDLVINPGGYTTWKGPYLQNDFNENNEDYKRDAWNNLYTYTGGVVITSSADGSSISKQFAGSTTELTSNTIKGTVRDKSGLPPSDSAANVTVTIYYPDGSGSVTSSSTPPARSGEFSFDNLIPMGIHLIRGVVSGADDTTSKYLAINPGTVTLAELRFPSDLWSGSGGGGGGTPATIIIRPNGAGQLTELTTEGCGSNWQCVDEETSDGDGTRVVRPSNTFGTDIYELEDPSVTSGTIDSVVVFAEAREEQTIGEIKLTVSTGGFVYEGAIQSMIQSYAIYSQSWTTNPQTGLAWTWQNIEDLEAGATIRGQNAVKPAYMTQVWVVVGYTN